MPIEIGQHQERSRDASGVRNAESAGVHQYFGWGKLRARLTEKFPNTTRETRRPMDKRFTQISATGVVQDHWTTEEVEEHLIAARIINNKQAQAEEKLVSIHKSLKQVHSALDHQCRELGASTKMLRHTILQVHEQSQVRAKSGSRSHGHGCGKREASIQG